MLGVLRVMRYQGLVERGRRNGHIDRWTVSASSAGSFYRAERVWESGISIKHAPREGGRCWRWLTRLPSMSLKGGVCDLAASHAAVVVASASKEFGLATPSLPSPLVSHLL